MSVVDLEAAHSDDENNGNDGYDTDNDVNEYEPEGLGNEELDSSDYEPGAEKDDIEVQLHRRAEAQLELKQQRAKRKAIQEEKQRLIQEKLEEELRDLKGTNGRKRLKKLPKDDDDDADIELQTYTNSLLPADSGNETEELDSSAAASAAPPIGYSDEAKIKKQSSMFSFMADKRPEWMVGDKFSAAVNHSRDVHTWKIEYLGALVPYDRPTWSNEHYSTLTPDHYTTVSRKEAGNTIYEIFLMGHNGFAQHVSRIGATTIEDATGQTAERRKRAREVDNLLRNNTTDTVQLVVPAAYYNWTCRKREKKTEGDGSSVPTTPSGKGVAAAAAAPSYDGLNVIQSTCNWALERLVFHQGLTPEKLETIFAAELKKWEEWAAETNGNPAKIWNKMRDAYGKDTGKNMVFSYPFLNGDAMKQMRKWIKELRKKEASTTAPA